VKVGLTVHVTKFEYTLVGPPMWIDVAIAFVVAVTLAIVSDDAREEAG